MKPLAAVIIYITQQRKSCILLKELKNETFFNATFYRDTQIKYVDVKYVSPARLLVLDIDK